MARRTEWQVRGQLRDSFLRCYDDDLEFQRRLRELASEARGLVFPEDEELSVLPHWATAVLVPSAAEALVTYCGHVQAFAEKSGLAGLASLPGIGHTDGPGLIHAWCVKRPYDAAPFSRSPFVHGGIGPYLTLRIEAHWDDSVKTLADFEYSVRQEVDRQLQRIRRTWLTDTHMQRRRHGDRDARFLYLRVRHQMSWAAVAATMEVDALDADGVAKAARRFATELGFSLRTPTNQDRADS